MTNYPTRNEAVRVSARELNRATVVFTESDEERAPKYLLLPTGVKANRLMVSGTLASTNVIGDSGMTLGNIYEPSVESDTELQYPEISVKAGAYQPDAKRTLENIEPPEYVTVVGKPDVYERSADDIRVSIGTPESVTVCEKKDRDAWVRETVLQTLDRLEAVESGDAPELDRAREEYDTLETDLQTVFEGVIDMAKNVLPEGELDSILEQYDGDFSVTIPDAESTGDADADAESDTESDADTPDDEPGSGVESDSDTDTEPSSDSDSDPRVGEDSESESPEEIGAGMV